MPIALPCPRCKAKLKGPDQLVGRTLKCPGCGTSVAITADHLVPAPPPADAGKADAGLIPNMQLDDTALKSLDDDDIGFKPIDDDVPLKEEEPSADDEEPFQDFEVVDEAEAEEVEVEVEEDEVMEVELLEEEEVDDLEAVPDEDEILDVLPADDKPKPRGKVPPKPAPKPPRKSGR